MSSQFSKLDHNQAKIVVDELFFKFDKNNNCGLSRTQFPQAINMILNKLGRQVLCHEDIVDLFQMLDVNGDQSISKEELFDLIIQIQTLIEKHLANKAKDQNPQ